MIGRDLANQLLSALFEPPCAACRSVLARPLDGAVCEVCWAGLRGLPHATSIAIGVESIDALASVGEYEGRLRDIVHALKYGGRRSIGPRLGALMREAGAAVLEGADAVVPVPLHSRREQSRGFNQAEDLARAIGLPVLRMLRRVVSTVPQVDLPAEARHQNVRHAFALAPALRSRFPASLSRLPVPASLPSPAGLVLVLVDDVITTGATLDACARMLKAAGARDVRALTAARVSTGRR